LSVDASRPMNASRSTRPFENTSLGGRTPVRVSCVIAIPSTPSSKNERSVSHRLGETVYRSSTRSNSIPTFPPSPYW
jgi:hypothetical protein